MSKQDIREQVSAEEWEARINLAACYRLMAHYQMTDLIANHITFEVPGEEQHFLINGYGFDYAEITASNLFKIDLEGNIILKPDCPYGISQAGFVIHSAIHAARRDLKCLIHTHTAAGMAVSATKRGLLPITQHAMRFYGNLGYHDYEGPAVDLDERRRLVADLGPHNAMVLRNHGLLAGGRSVAEAFNAIFRLESACRAQVFALATGEELVTPPAEVVEKTSHLYKPGVRRVFGELEWDAMLRIIDRKDPSFRM